MKTRVMTTAALLAAAAMILSYVESLLPSVGIPGVKMGLANIAVIFALYRLGWRLAAWISLVRVVTVTLLFGTVAALAYSLAGAVLSLLGHGGLRGRERFSPWGVSVAGGVGPQRRADPGGHVAAGDPAVSVVFSRAGGGRCGRRYSHGPLRRASSAICPG